MNGIMNFHDRNDKLRRFRKDSVVAIETFISTRFAFIETESDNWGLIGSKGGFVAQHEHTILIISYKPIILTAGNGI
jgi:methionyl aminopeptidase